MIRALSSLLLIAFFSTGCGWLQSPVPSRNFDVQWDLQDPTHSQRQARLFLTDDGLWGYQPERQKDFRTEYAAGDILQLHSKSGHHFFVVTEATPWSYRLQRLDDHPLENTLQGELLPVSAANIPGISEVCLVPAGNTIQDACGADHRHRRWHLFELTDTPGPDTKPLRLSVANSTNTERAFPFQRVGLSGADILNVWVEGSLPKDRPLLAILATPRNQSTPLASLAVDPNCGDFSFTSTLVEAIPLRIDAPSSKLHPLHIESLASQYSVDALLDCPEPAPRLLVPTLSRPMLKDDAGRFISPPAIGLLPRQLPGISPATREAWANAAALIAVGDTTASAFWIEVALNELPNQKAIKELAISALPILASAGLPELAIHYGNLLTQGAWNPENIPDFLETKILLFGQFNMVREQQELLKRPPELAKSLRDPFRSAWHGWSAARQGIDQGRTGYGPAFAPLIEELEKAEQEEWALALWLTLAMKGLELPVVDEPAALQHRFDRANAGALWRSITADEPATTCQDQVTCRLGSYGWRANATAGPTSSKELLHRLHRMSPIENRRGFSLAALTPSMRDLELPSERSAFWLASSALTPPEQLPTLAKMLINELQEQMRRQPDSICDDLMSWQARFENAAARSQAPVLPAERRQWINLLEWWSTKGLMGLCGTTTELLAAMESPAIADNRWLITLFPLLEDRLLVNNSPGQGLTDFQRAATLASSLGAHRACTLWSLGISIGTARQGLLDQADAHLVRATNCLNNEEELRDLRNLVATYIDFERGGGRHIIRDGRIDTALAQLTQRQIRDPQLCIGLLPLGFQLEDHLPETITRIADAIYHVPAPPESFRLQTASQLVNEASSALLTGLRDLQRGHWKSALHPLARAHGAFQRLEHLPGLVKINYLDTLFFGGRLLDLASGLITLDDLDLPDSDAFLRLRQGDSHLFIKEFAGVLDLESPPPEELELFVAAMIINKRADELAPYTERLPASLCSAPELAEEYPLVNLDDSDDEL